MSNASPAQHPRPARSSGPAAQLRLGGRTWGALSWLSLVGHAALLVLVVAQGRRLLGNAESGAASSGAGGESVQFFALPAPAGVVAVEVPPAPSVTLKAIPPIEPLAVDLTRITVPDLSQTAAAERAPTGAAGRDRAGGGGDGGRRGEGAGDGGTGTGREGGYILLPNPLTVIVPPAEAPKSVRGRRFRATFWVGADGRVQRVELNPPITDASYREALLERLMDFAFYPARNRSGLAIPGVVPIVFDIP